MIIETIAIVIIVLIFFFMMIVQIFKIRLNKLRRNYNGEEDLSRNETISGGVGYRGEYKPGASPDPSREPVTKGDDELKRRTILQIRDAHKPKPITSNDGREHREDSSGDKRISFKRR